MVKVPWTKLDEIALLRATAEKLGPASYAGAWLADCLPDIEHLISVDWPIEDNINSPRRAADLAIATLADARKTASAILADARSEADNIMFQARGKAQKERQNAREDLRAMLQRIQDDI